MIKLQKVNLYKG